MNSLVLRTVARVVAPVVMLYGVRLLLVGHDSPGGGFVGGLVTALAVVLGWMAFGPPPRARRWEHRTQALLYAGPVKLPTSLFFDVGVFLVVVSATLAAVRTLWEAGS